MDTFHDGFSDCMKGFSLSYGSDSVCSNQNLVDGFLGNHEFTPPVFFPSNLDHPNDSTSSLSSGSDTDTIDTSDCNLPVLRYISDILLEEDLEGKPCMLQDYYALQAAEKSFYDALNQKDPPLPSRPVQPPFLMNQNIENSDGACYNSSNGSPSDFRSKNSSVVWDFSKASQVQTSQVESVSDTITVSNSHAEVRSLGNFGGLGEEIESFDLENLNCMHPGFDQWLPGPNSLVGNLASEAENHGYSSANRSKGKKKNQREDDCHYSDEGRTNKQPAACADDSGVQEMYDKVLIQVSNPDSESCLHDDQSVKAGENRKLQHNKQSKGSKTTRSKKQNGSQRVVDLCKLLTECAQAVSSFDQQSATELLKEIREHASPYGDATQRIAHYFANGLEVRLGGEKIPFGSPTIMTHISATEILKAYQVYVAACPFKKMLHFFTNRTIMKRAEKATRLHIIDFGISYGFQWPCLIQSLSEQAGGPPNLRITAIELPYPGFRPAARIEETVYRLAKYCDRYNVPFEYNIIAKKWETIRLEDLQINRNEVNVVNCMHRLKQLPDETVMLNNPRDAVLNLIRKINPDLFMHGVVNGAYSAPAFVTRFKQALFHFSALFDMYEATVPREDEHRMLFERAIFGRDIVNVVSCEGLERVERPETYKQWQARYVRAGFEQLPLDRELLKKVKTMSKMMGYHNDFRIEDDGQWMLQGWKGRIIIALTALKPA